MSVDPKQPADTAAPFDPASAGWQRHAVDGFLDLVGPIWERPSGDSYRYAFLAEPKHHSRRGHVQGGMLTRFADRAMGRTCWHANERQPQTTVQLDIHFVDAVRVGDFVEARCTVVRRTRTLVFHERRACSRRARSGDSQWDLEDTWEGMRLRSLRP